MMMMILVKRFLAPMTWTDLHNNFDDDGDDDDDDDDDDIGEEVSGPGDLD